MPSYPHVTNVTLAGWLAAITSGVDYIPTDAELANLLGQVDVQTRRFVYDYLATKFDATTEKLLPAVVDDTSIVGKVKGSTSNSGTQQGIVQGTVSTPDLRDQAVATAKLGDNAVTTVKIADAQITTAKIVDVNVTTGKIADLAVTTAKIADANVTNAKMASNSVGTSNIIDANVTTAKIANNAVGSAQLFLASTAADILVADSGKAFQSKAMSGDATIDVNGKVTLAALGFASIREKAANTVAGGASAAGINTRGTSVAWVIHYNPSSLVSISGTKFLLTAGTYIIEASAPAYSGGLHTLRLAQRLGSDDSDIQLEYGTTEVAQLGVQSRSTVIGKFVVAGTTQYFRLEHFIELVKGTNGLGLPTSNGFDEIYATVKIQKIAV